MYYSCTYFLLIYVFICLIIVYFAVFACARAWRRLSCRLVRARRPPLRSWGFREAYDAHFRDFTPDLDEGGRPWVRDTFSPLFCFLLISLAFGSCLIFAGGVGRVLGSIAGLVYCSFCFVTRSVFFISYFGSGCLSKWNFFYVFVFLSSSESPTSFTLLHRPFHHLPSLHSSLDFLSFSFS